MSSRITRSRSHVATASDAEDDASRTLSVSIDSEIEQLVTDAASGKQAKQAKTKDADDANLSGLTKADLLDMLNAQKEMLHETILAHTAQNAAANAAVSAATTTLPIRVATRKMIDPTKFRGGAQDLDRFLSQLKHRFNT